MLLAELRPTQGAEAARSCRGPGPAAGLRAHEATAAGPEVCGLVHEGLAAARRRWGWFGPRSRSGLGFGEA